MPTQDQISPGFGANEWMVEEMRAAAPLSLVALSS